MDILDRIDDPRAWLAPSEALGRTPPRSAKAEPAPRASGPAVRFGFRAGPLGLLIDVGVTGEILERASIYPVPNTAGWLLGIVNQRGNLVPVFDLAALVGEPTVTGTDARLLVVGTGADAVAFPVAALPKAVRAIAPLDPRPQFPEPFESHARAAFLSDDELWLEVDFSGLLTGLSDELSR